MNKPANGIGGGNKMSNFKYPIKASVNNRPGNFSDKPKGQNLLFENISLDQYNQPIVASEKEILKRHSDLVTVDENDELVNNLGFSQKINEEKNFYGNQDRQSHTQQQPQFSTSLFDNKAPNKINNNFHNIDNFHSHDNNNNSHDNNNNNIFDKNQFYNNNNNNNDNNNDKNSFFTKSLATQFNNEFYDKNNNTDNNKIQNEEFVLYTQKDDNAMLIENDLIKSPSKNFSDNNALMNSPIKNFNNIGLHATNKKQKRKITYSFSPDNSESPNKDKMNNEIEFDKILNDINLVKIDSLEQQTPLHNTNVNNNNNLIDEKMITPENKQPRDLSGLLDSALIGKEATQQYMIDEQQQQQQQQQNFVYKFPNYPRTALFNDSKMGKFFVLKKL